MYASSSNPSWTFAPPLGKYNICGESFLQETQNACYDRLVIGVAIFVNDRLLVVQRASNEDQFPDMYELPGGHVELTDSTILGAVVRETQEETGLDISHIDACFDDFEYETVQDAAVKRTLQLNFRVSVKEFSDIRLNPEEHQAYRCISSGDIDSIATTEEMRTVIRNAFK